MVADLIRGDDFASGANCARDTWDMRAAVVDKVNRLWVVGDIGVEVEPTAVLPAWPISNSGPELRCHLRSPQYLKL